jgi:hypothetical protein
VTVSTRDDRTVTRPPPSPGGRKQLARRLRRVPPTVVVASLLLTVAAACGSSSKGHATGTTGATLPTRTTTTVPGTSTTGPGTAATTTTTLGPPPAAGSIPFIDFAGTSPPDGVSPAGSGCTPPSATTLPDGTWFGMLKSVEPNAGTLRLDLACIYGGSAANAAAAADGHPTPVMNDHYIRNRSANVYTLHAVPGVAVGVLGANGSAAAYYPNRTGLAAVMPLVGTWVWVQVNRGWVVAVQQLFVP